MVSNKLESNPQKRQDILTSKPAKLGYWEFDVNNNNLYCSEELYDIFGITPGNVVLSSEEFIKMIHNDDRDAVKKVYTKSIKNEKSSYEIEYRINKQDANETRFILEKCVHKKNEVGQVVNSIGIVQDITNQKQLENNYQQLLGTSDQKAHYYTREANKAKKQVEAEIEKARQIHERTFLGKSSEIDNLQDVSLEAHYYPAEQIGGDFYNFIKVKDKLIIYLSDVAGHGIEAAIISSFVKESIRNYAKLRPEELSPTKILYHLNQQYGEDEFPDDYFVCIFLAVLDLNTYELSYTGTGMHLSPFVKLANGNCIHLQSVGPPVSSAIPQELMNFDTDSIILSPGSIVIFYTDGIAEQRDQEDNSYTERLKNIFFTQENKFPPELIKQVINTDFMEFNGSLQGDDDITYVILQINPPERKEYSWQLNSKPEEIERFYSKVVTIINNFINEKTKVQGLYELIVNALEHGNKYDSNKKIYIDLVLTADYIFVTVADEGEGFNWKQKLNSNQGITHSGERDRGLIISRLLGEKLFYNQKGNKAFFILESKN